MLFDTLSAGRARLIAAGLSPADADADVDLFARTILGWERARLLASRRDASPAALEPTFSDWIARRAAREPAAYITGQREFWGRPFHVTPSVLIPRPETELILEEVLPLMRDIPHPRVADVGTGSGCLAVSIAAEHLQSHVVATDLSAEALRVARENARRHAVDARVAFVCTSYLEGINLALDVIVANPPYVRDGDARALSPDVRHEPEVALFGGADGLRNVAGVIDTALGALRPGGWLAMEFGYGQEDEVAALVERHPPLQLVRIRGDLQQIPRTAIIQRR